MEQDKDYTFDKQKNSPHAGVEGGSADKIKIGLVEDQFLFRKGIKAILSAWANIEVMFESADGFSVIQKLKESVTVPDVILVDMSLPPDGKKEFNGLDVTVALKEYFPDIKIIILSVYDDDHFIAKLIKTGAHGYLAKDSDPQEVYDAITSVHTRGIYINEKTLLAIQNNAHKKNTSKGTGNTISDVVLTRREEEILMLVCKQKTTDEIAEELFISPKTVNGHRNNLLQKTGSRNVAGLVAYALTRRPSF
ncbi:MAG: response regulator transcription factor [Bacteroidota bacterium]